MDRKSLKRAVISWETCKGRNQIEYINSIDEDISIFDNAGKCVKLTDNGCEYSDEKCHFGGVALIPRVTEDGERFVCRLTYSVMDNAMEWLEFHAELWNIINQKKGE